MLISLILATALHTVTADTGETIEIESDSSKHAKLDNYSEWSGKVTVTNDGYIMRSDRLVAFYDDQNRIIKLIATGQPVRITGSNRDGSTIIEGETVIYDAKDDVATSIGHARYDNGTTNLRGHSILYRFVQRYLESEGNQENQIRTEIDP